MIPPATWAPIVGAVTGTLHRWGNGVTLCGRVGAPGVAPVVARCNKCQRAQSAAERREAAILRHRAVARMERAVREVLG